MGLDTTSIVCALLHDTVEDTWVTLDDVERMFRQAGAGHHRWIDQDFGIFDPAQSAQAENFRKMLLTLSDDIRVILIKIADRLHNMRTLDSMKREKQLKIAGETDFHVCPFGPPLGAVRDQKRAGGFELSAIGSLKSTLRLSRNCAKQRPFAPVSSTLSQRP